MRLANKVAVITGAASGIGRATAIRFAKEGADIVIPDVNFEGAQAVAKEVEALGSRALAVQCDVSDPGQVNAMVQQAVGKFDKIDILVNNAGVLTYSPFLEMSLEDWNRILRICLTGYFVVGQAVAREMVKGGRGGKIVNIASLAGVTGLAHLAAYGSAKGGVVILTKVMASELGQHGINVNAVAPGATETPMTANISNDVPRASASRRPINRSAQPEEMAAAILFLASDDASYVTGHVLNVDGGMNGVRSMPPEA